MTGTTGEALLCRDHLLIWLETLVPFLTQIDSQHKSQSSLKIKISITNVKALSV